MKTVISQINTQRLFLAALTTALLAASGCGEKGPVPPATIEIFSGRDQAGMPGQEIQPLVVRVLGPRKLDFLGRKQERFPAAGVAVKFQVEEPRTNLPSAKDDAPQAPPQPAEKGAAPPQASGTLPPHPVLFALDRGTPGSSGQPGPPGGSRELEVTTDASGLARVGVRLGSRNGQWNVEARVSKNDKVRFRTITGVELEKQPLEGVVGAKVPLRMWLRRLRDPADPASLVPLEGRQVVYRIVGTPDPLRVPSADIKDKRNDTDSDGLREGELTLGDLPGTYTVIAEIESYPEDDRLPPVTLTVVGTDWLRTFLLCLSGIFVFVIGVRLLGNGFLLLTSTRMHLPTGPWAQNRFLGYLGGIVSGAIFESSSLVQSYLVSFANGGLLTAAGGLGLMLGANLGGTILPQLLARQIEWLSVPCLAAGLLLLLAPRHIRLRSWGWVFLGAGLVITGWSLMQESASLASLSGRFKDGLQAEAVDYALGVSSYVPHFFTLFAVAAVIACVLRTSNLVVVIAMLLASAGMLSLSTAIPLTIGANFGSSVRVFLFSLQKRREAQRVATANLLAQGIVCLGLILLSLVTSQDRSIFGWAVEALVPGGAFSESPANIALHVAMAHTLLNFLGGAVFLFLPGKLLRQVDRLFPLEGSATPVKPFLLDKNLVTVPALALRQATEETVYLTEICRKTLAEAFDSFRYNDLDLSEQVVRREEVVTSIHREVSQYLVEVAGNQLSSADASQLEVLQTAVSNLVRIGVLGERYRDLAARKVEENVQATDEVERELNDVYDLVLGQFANILALLRQQDARTEENAVKVVERLAKFSSRVEAQWRQRVEQADSGVSPLALHLQTVIYQEAFGILFQIAAHLGHVAERMRVLRPRSS